jgi:hypothetical protein
LGVAILAASVAGSEALKIAAGFTQRPTVWQFLLLLGAAGSAALLFSKTIAPHPFFKKNLMWYVPLYTVG